MSVQTEREKKEFYLLTSEAELCVTTGLSTDDPQQWYIPSIGSTCIIDYTIFPLSTSRDFIREKARGILEAHEKRFGKIKRNFDEI